MAPLPTNPPNNTNSAQPAAGQKTSARPLKTWVIPGLKGGQGWSEKTKPPIMSDFIVPLKRVGLVVITLFLGIWLLSFLYHTITSAFSGGANKKTETIPASSVATTTTPTTTQKAQNDSCQGIGAKMQAAQVSSKQVDKIFQQKHPDRVNKPITNTDQDAVLKQEWCQIAEELFQKK